MILVWATLLTLLNCVWLFLGILGLPGTWLMVASTALLAWWQWDADGDPSERMFSITVLIVVAALALLGEIMELAAGLIGSKKAGGTKWGAIGALLGTIVGGVAGTFLIPVPVVGSIVGACLGAAIGAGALEMTSGRELAPSVKSGVGAGVGRLGGVFIKLGIGVLIWVIVAVAAFWP
jgi:uncharacterized protein YqgC (DUF456 family)